MNTTTTQLLADRYRLGASPLLSLDPRQREARERVLERLWSGGYQMVERPCPSCGSQRFLLIAEQDRYALPVSTVLCLDCGLLQTNPVMRPEDYQHFYTHLYRSLYVGEPQASEAFLEEQREHGEAIMQYLGFAGALSSRSLRVLEVGCGAGGILLPFQERGHRVMGLDLGVDYLEKGRSHGLDLRQGSIESLQEGERFDIIIYSHVLEHIYDLHAELELVSRHLAPAGALYMEVPGLYRSWRYYRGDLLLFLQNAHLVHFTRLGLDRLLATQGFRRVLGTESVRAVYQRGRSPDFPPGHSTVVLRYLRWQERLRPLISGYHSAFAER